MKTKTRYLDLGMFINIAAELLDVDVRTASNVVRISAASSALNAASANCFGHELYPDVVLKVGISGYKLVRNHLLPDGNKRAAFVSMIVMARLNGLEWDVVDEDESVETMFAVAAGKIDEVTFVEWVRKQVHFPDASPAVIGKLYSFIAEPYANQYGDDISDLWLVHKLLAALPPSARVLDVGCGPGTFAEVIVSSGASYVGVDLSPKMLDIARRRAPRGAFLQMDMRSLEFDASEFDAVIAAYSLIHIPDDAIPATLREISRVMKPDGRLLIIGQHGRRDHLEDDPLAPGEQVLVNFFTLERMHAHLDAVNLLVRESGCEKSSDPQSMSEGVVWVLAEKSN